MIEKIELAKEAIEKVVDLPAMPQIMVTSLELLSDLSSDVNEIQKQISLDQALVAFVLKVANSPFYGLRCEVSTVTHAINLIGYNSMRSLLLSYLMKQVYQKGDNKFIQHTLWKHSLAAAFFSRELARATKAVNYEEAFIAGLMHDIGKGALLSTFPQKFESAVERHINDQVPFLKAEENVFEFSHIEVGYLLMKKWNFAQHLIESEIYHHSCQEYHGGGKMVYIVSLANKLANLNGFSFVKINEELFEAQILNLADPAIRESEARSLEEIEKFQQVAG